MLEASTFVSDDVLKASLVAQILKNLPVKQETRVRSLGREDPLEKEWQPTLVFSPGEFHSMDRGAWQDALKGVTESQTQLSN